MKKILSVVFMLLLLLGIQASALAEDQLFSEGVDTRCKVLCQGICRKAACIF